ncbi:MAG: ribokinase [Bacteroides sp.]|nr:ribokinase [Bacteroides sp.]
MGNKIVVVGSSNIDMTTVVSSLPGAGETVRAHNYIEAFGGKGANQAVAAARLGGGVSFISALGVDNFASDLKRHFVKEGIDISGIVDIEGENTGIALIMVDSNGENCIAVYPGANGYLREGHINSFKHLIEDADILVLQAEVPYSTVKAAAEIAAESGTAVLYNPAPVLAVDDAMMKMVSVLVVNETEGSKLSGVIGHHEVIAKALHTKGAHNVVITLGSRGVYAFDGNTGIYVPAFKVDAIDSVGAGDTFCGALAVSFAKTHKIDRKSLKYAAAASAICVTRSGAQPSIPTADEVTNFIESYTL